MLRLSQNLDFGKKEGGVGKVRPPLKYTETTLDAVFLAQLKLEARAYIARLHHYRVYSSQVVPDSEEFDRSRHAFELRMCVHRSGGAAERRVRACNPANLNQLPALSSILLTSIYLF